MARRLSPQLRFKIYQRDGFRCQYCGVPATHASLHIDHIEPVADGGTDDTSNLTLACRKCNAGKSDTPLPEPLRLELRLRALLRDRYGYEEVCAHTLSRSMADVFRCHQETLLDIREAVEAALERESFWDVIEHLEGEMAQAWYFNPPSQEVDGRLQ